MPDKEKVKLLWDSVRTEEDIPKAVKMIADLAEQAIKERIDETEKLRQTVIKLSEDIRLEFKTLQKTLYGNGDPSHSILARLERIEEMQCKASENANRASWIIISAVIVQVVLYLLEVL